MNILFYPSYPDKEYYSISQIMHRLGYTATVDTDDIFDLAFCWDDSTKVTIAPTLDDIENQRQIAVINIGCTDISKNYVEELHKVVFGYGSFIDPTTFKGYCVEKPDDNGVKGGRVILCPISQPVEGKVYQQIIEEQIDGYQIEYRVPVILGEIPLIYRIKQVPPTDALDNREQLPPELMDVDTVFSNTEIQQMLEFCKQLKLDFGELDVLRCPHGGRIFIIDANKTPAGYGLLNRFCWRIEDRNNALQCLADTFARAAQQLLERP